MELREKYPKLCFSSCTRLGEVKTSRDKRGAGSGHKDGTIEAKPDGEKGISAKLRSIHGGLFPHSDVVELVVADDPLAEIAPPIWIDEYAKLDRNQLLELPYSEWLAQAEPEVVTVVNNPGRFLPNTKCGTSCDLHRILRDSNWKILGTSSLVKILLLKPNWPAPRPSLTRPSLFTPSSD